jgi:hypothetical protein
VIKNQFGRTNQMERVEMERSEANEFVAVKQQKYKRTKEGDQKMDTSNRSNQGKEQSNKNVSTSGK